MRKLIYLICKDGTSRCEAASVFLSVSLLVTVFSIFDTGILAVLGFGIAEVLLCIPFLLLCHFTNNHRRLGTVLCILIYGLCLFGGFYLSFMGYMETGESLMQWLVNDNDQSSVSVAYMIILAVGGAAFFESVSFYFAVVNYRLGMLVVTSLIPCVLYAKAIADVNNWYLVLIALANILIAFLQKRKKLGFTEFRNVYGGLGAVYIFSCLIFIIAAVIPKRQEAIFYSVFEDTFLGGDTSSDISGIASDLTDYSGNADGYNPESNRRLYSINGANVTYLKRQNFDIYDFDKDRWTALEEWNTGVEADSLTIRDNYLSFTYLYDALRHMNELDEDFLDKYNYSGMLSLNSFTEVTQSINVRSLNFPASYYIVPQGTFEINPSDSDEVMVTKNGTFSRKSGKHAADFYYSVRYRDVNAAVSGWLDAGGGCISGKDFESMLSEMSDVLLSEITEENPSFDAGSDYGENSICSLEELVNCCEQNSIIFRETASVLAFYEEYEDTLSYLADTEDNTALIPSEIVALSEEITKGCEYDYEKALALQNFFHDGSFIYDSSYDAKDDSVSYFLFSSKRGTCSDYATAYVLLARAAGLKVRYAEGYVTERSGRGNVFYIKESGSHAYPEVYITGAGWMIFEPTSGIVEESGESIFAGLFKNIEIDYTLIMVIGIIIAAAVVIVLIIKLIIPLVCELIFLFKLRAGVKNATDAYKRLIKTADLRRLKKKYQKQSGTRYLTRNRSAKTLSPDEISGLFAKQGTGIETIVSLVDCLAYSKEKDLKTTAIERKKIYKEYLKAAGIFDRR